METRANYVLIGAFTVLTAVFLLLFALLGGEVQLGPATGTATK